MTDGTRPKLSAIWRGYLAEHGDDLLILLGAVLALYGLYRIYEPLLFVGAGLFLALTGLGLARLRGPDKE